MLFSTPDSPNGLFVVHERLVQLPLLLQDRGQVGMSSSKLGEHLESLQVQPRGLLDVALLALDVGQIVERVRMRRTESEGGVVTFFGFEHLQTTKNKNVTLL